MIFSFRLIQTPQNYNTTWTSVSLLEELVDRACEAESELVLGSFMRSSHTPSSLTIRGISSAEIEEGLQYMMPNAVHEKTYCDRQNGRHELVACSIVQHATMAKHRDAAALLLPSPHQIRSWHTASSCPEKRFSACICDLVRRLEPKTHQGRSTTSLQCTTCHLSEL